VLVTGLVAVGGCQFFALRENLRALDQVGFLRGVVTAPADAPGPLIVFAVPASATDGAAVDWAVLARPGAYFLVVPVGTYRIGAFEDRNHSLTHDPGEAGGWVQDGRPIATRAGETTAGLNLALNGGAPTPPFAVTLPVRGDSDVTELPASRVGELTTLDDPRFSDENARIGLWRPVEFLVDVGAGIYFLEPYDPTRTPVLFVHGALGHPANFRTLIDSLDKTRYQAWVAYYPTAVHLDVVGAAMGRWLQALEAQYHFPRLGVVAHSMGGLVARAYLNGDRNGLGGELESLAFVSIATPWQGHAMAARGVANAPVVAPSWFDMAPGSPFLGTLLATPPPRYATYDLDFAYGGRQRRGPANDGVVTLASQLDLRAQEQARRVMGFDAGHGAVLDEPMVADAVHQSLEGVAPPAP
jgi:pimeloyl-ACP methyl ester carboxylesterase